MTKKRRSSQAVSEILDVVLLLGITMVLFSILYFVVFSYTSSPNPPSVHLIGTVEEDTITIANLGGSSLSPDTEVILTIDNNTIQVKAEQFLVDTNNNGYWDVGEEFVKSDTILSYLNSKATVGATVVDKASNSIIMTGLLQLGTPGGVPPNETMDILDYVDNNRSNIDGVSNKGIHGNFENEKNKDGSYDVLMEKNIDIKDFVDTDNSDLDTSPNKGTHSNFENEKSVGGGYDVLTEKNTSVDIKDPVDDNTCNMDGIGDKGSETNFLNAQGITLDSNSMTIQEANQGAITNEHYNYVDSYSNSHPPTDIGTHSNFAEMQDRDGIYDTLTEAFNPSQVTYVSAGAGDASTGSSINVPYANAVTGDLFLLQVMILDTSNTPSVGSGFSILYGPDSNTDGRQWIYYKFCTGSESDRVTVTCSGSAGKFGRMYSFRNVATSSFTEGGGHEYNSNSRYVNDVGVTTSGALELTVNFVYIGEDDNYFSSFNGESGGNWVEAVSEFSNSAGNDGTLQLQIATMSSSGTVNGGSYDMSNSDPWGNRGFALKPINSYRLDLEVGWTSAYHDETNEYLCIYGGTQDSEALQVDVWNSASSSWTTVITDLLSGWNNVSVSPYITSSNFQIRFVDTNQNSDTTQSTWQVEGVLLHTWSQTNNYQIDFEYQWTTANYNQVNEQLCFYVSSHTGTENLLVNYWTGSGWSSLGTITGTGSRILPATGLTSSTYTIQLRGATESGDSTQDSWDIDCIFLHCYSLNYSLDLEVQWTGVDFNQVNEFLCIKTGSLDSIENLKVEVRIGSTWAPLISALQQNTWNNVSVSSYLTSGTLTIRYLGSVESGDTKQSSWSIDAALLHLVSPDYKLDLEVQWTSVKYLLAHKEICIYTGSLGSENIIVDAWNGNTWIPILNPLQPFKWNNASISVTGSRFIIRYRDDSPINDLTQNVWNIDAALIHLWS
jgi:hypothetical protein